MARRPAAAIEDIPAEAEALENIAAPREQLDFFGHREAEQALLEAHRSGRPHHGWLLSGDRGIGKATLAFRFARFLLSHPSPDDPAVTGASSLATGGDERGARQVAIGAHPSLLHLKRPWDDKAKRFKTDLTVDEVRRLVPFLGATAADGGFRVVVVDAAEDMNASAANALLKSLEEPPARTIFMLVTHAPGRLLPTIRSRCRLLLLRPLSADDVAAALAALGLAGRHPGSEIDAVIGLAGGSVRRAVTLLDAGGAALAADLTRLLEAGAGADRRQIFALADRLAGAKGAAMFDTVLDLIEDWLTSRLKSDVAARRDAARLHLLAAVWNRLAQKRRETDIYNLDRKELLLDLFEAVRAVQSR